MHWNWLTVDLIIKSISIKIINQNVRKDKTRTHRNPR
jgi:hypothetical protein